MLLKFMRFKKAQSIIEYVMLFVIVAAAITLTYKYVYRSMNARLKQVQEELTYKRD
jgi:cell division protein FtsL